MSKSRYTSYYEKRYKKELKKDFKYLFFSNKKLEQEFLTFYNSKFKQSMTLSLLIGVGLFLSSGILDFFYAKNMLDLQIVRFLIILPIALMIYFFMKNSKKMNYLIQYLLIVVIIAIAIGTLSIGLLQPNPMRDMYFNGLLLILIFTFTFSRLQFWNALFTSIILYLILLIALYLDEYATDYIIIYHSFIYFSGTLILGFSSYLSERAIRINYLQNILLDIEQKNLKEAKIHLEKLSSIDDVTGIFNHRYFHQILKITWNQCLRKKESIALLIIDIDFFKKYNDFYGHQEGDKCLKKVANAIKSSVRRSTDLAARYGGDEFVVLINDINAKNLNIIAENIRENIIHLNLEHKIKKSKPVTTSIGAIITTPRINNEPSDLIAVADGALYQAKNKGRNCIVIIDTNKMKEKDLIVLRKKQS